MPNKFAWFLTLAIFSGLSMNLILRFGIGLQQIASGRDSVPSGSAPSGKNSGWVFFIWPGIYFVSVLLLWLFFSSVQSVLFLGFVEYILVFPVSSLFFSVIEYLVKRLNKSLGGEIIPLDCFSFMGDCGGVLHNVLHNAVANGAMAGSALFIILGLSGGIAEAATLSFGFSAGAALAVLIIGEIRRRSLMEAVPRCLKGGPLVLVTMGLLSLVFTSAAVIFYTVLGAY